MYNWVLNALFDTLFVFQTLLPLKLLSRTQSKIYDGAFSGDS